MRIRWSGDKYRMVIVERGIDFARLPELMAVPYIEDQRSEVPEQYRIIGFIDGRMNTFIVEYRQDAEGEYIWVVTAWKSTTSEERAYEQETR